MNVINESVWLICDLTDKDRVVMNVINESVCLIGDLTDKDLVVMRRHKDIQ